MCPLSTSHILSYLRLYLKTKAISMWTVGSSTVQPDWLGHEAVWWKNTEQWQFSNSVQQPVPWKPEVYWKVLAPGAKEKKTMMGLDVDPCTSGGKRFLVPGQSSCGRKRALYCKFRLHIIVKQLSFTSLITHICLSWLSEMLPENGAGDAAWYRLMIMLMLILFPAQRQIRKTPPLFVKQLFR